MVDRLFAMLCHAIQSGVHGVRMEHTHTHRLIYWHTCVALTFVAGKQLLLPTEMAYELPKIRLPAMYECVRVCVTMCIPGFYG